MCQIKSCILIILLYLFVYSVYGQGKVIPKNVPDTLPAHVDSLKAVIVTAQTRPKMKGDTLEYSVEHMVLQRNAVVEELLRQLPGLRVDPDGTITYNGERIQHLLVDGEDIFGNSPAMVTRSFDASKIARVQILDRRSDRAIFTGIEDGARTKTLNLVLRESAKDGYFGRVGVGGNSEGHYNANAALAAFRRKEQLTAIGLAANNGEVDFGNSGSGAMVTFMNVNADALDASAGTGVPRFAATALHYANAWTESLMHLTANYQYSHYYSQPVCTTQTLQTLPNSVYGQHQLSRSTNRQDQHWLYGVYDWAPNAISAFKVTFHYSNSEGVNQLGTVGSTSLNDTVVNSSLRTIQDRVNLTDIGGDLSGRIQVGKRIGRTFSFSAYVDKKGNNTNGYVYSLNSFYYPNGRIERIDTVDQRKQVSSNSLDLGGSFSYTEPMYKGALLGLDYAIFHFADDPLQATYSRGEGQYLDIVDTLSSHVKTQTVNQRGSLILQGKVGSLGYTLGGEWQGYAYLQRGVNASDSSLHLSYSNWAPRVLLNFRPNNATSFSFNYAASVSQPLPTQVTPLKNNNDPLHITLGNPDLKPGFSQNLRLDFRRIKTWLTYVILKIGITGNSISSKTISDSLGRQISQSVNIDGGRSGEINFSFNRKLLGLDAGFRIDGTYARTLNYVNEVLNRNEAYTADGGFSISKFLEKWYSSQLSAKFTYFDQVNSVNVAAPIRYWSQIYSGSISIFLIKDFEINTNFSYTWQQKSSAYATNTSVFLWNADVSRNFFHDRLVGKFQFNNIFNANAGISRTNMGNVNTQSSTNILGRYWMVSLTYIFDKKFRRK